MKKILRIAGLLFFLTIAAVSYVKPVYAQCAMCTLNAEQSVKDGNSQGKGLNKGILFLLAMPYLAVGAVGYMWYKKYRRKQVDVNFKHDPINLN
ncbi:MULTISPECIES: hypothetical protein [Olivibacter]|jgi:hypothetical protein|uniref:Uncharacterized protein n=3 Tax=Sphingobacteriaceae TaxID=84566 RepID=F4C3E7_SPHS2|nr:MULTISPECIES: hypothetical protein [Olivibacter]MCL4639789.1 hypothetical protein [Olivibacter sp. UJ_SKK_5.1]MDM8177052.1 hypothetical protein [Olivibacter sp. 47]MDX3912420.1 hypothetical protein [Pseudosphingobacterium sp.]QEL00141.1 hypothetical protein FKG96_04760 [Olivibacter sp. LS-1]